MGVQHRETTELTPDPGTQPPSGDPRTSTASGLGELGICVAHRARGGAGDDLRRRRGGEYRRMYRRPVSCAGSARSGLWRASVRRAGDSRLDHRRVVRLPRPIDAASLFRCGGWSCCCATSRSRPCCSANSDDAATTKLAPTPQPSCSMSMAPWLTRTTCISTRGSARSLRWTSTWKCGGFTAP